MKYLTTAINFFDTLYNYKKAYLMAEAYLSRNHTENIIKPEINRIKITDTMMDLVDIIRHTTNKLLKCVPVEITEEWTCADYTAYTDVYYHRQFWNEIPNDELTEKALERFLEIEPPVGCINKPYEQSYMVLLYDFNDFDIMFDNKTHLTDFLDKHSIDTVTTFSYHNGAWSEEYVCC